MFTIKFTSQFKKSYKNCLKRGLDMTLLDNVLSSLRLNEELESKYQDHRLSGPFKGYRECHIKPDWLLIYLVDEETNIIVLINTGSHSDLF